MNELPSFLQSVRMGLSLDQSIFDAVQSTPAGLRIALLVVFLAAVSEALGQSVVLFLNRVRPGRFVLALSLAVGSNVVGYLFWSVSVWLAGILLFGHDKEFWQIASVVGLAYAPQILAFFNLIPYFGSPFALFLSLWSMMLVIVAIRSGMDLATWQAATIGALSWLLLQLWRRSLGRPLYSLGRRLQRRAAGARLDVSMNDVFALQLRRHHSKDNRRAWMQQQRDAIHAQFARIRKGDSPHD
jgi:hypothetical protein